MMASGASYGAGLDKLGAPKALLIPVEQWESVAATTAMSAVLLLIAVAVIRRMLIRKRLSQRVAFELLPTNGFDPTSEDILRFGRQLARSRPSVWSGAPRTATAIRLRLAIGADGKLRYLLEGHPSSASVLRHQTYTGVEIRQLEQAEEGQPPSPKAHVARAELVLAKDPAHPLRIVPLKPDPLEAIAAAVYDIRNDLGERADISLDLVPLTPARVAHLRKQRLRASDHQNSMNDPAGSVSLDDIGRMLKYGPDKVRVKRPQGRNHPTARDRAAEATAVGKLTGLEPVYAIQILIRVESEIDGRAEAHLHQILAAFDQWAGPDNWWRAAGPNLRLLHFGADSPLRRRGFDRRFRTGEFKPTRQSWVTPSEIGGLLKPPTKHCAKRNVARSGGLIPPPPKDLPPYNGRADLLPLGWIRRPDGTEVLAGAPLEETLFSLRAGKTGCGKTELALVQAVALARTDHGVWFLDPHRDGWERAKPYLCTDELYGRIWEIDLTTRSLRQRQCGWNPLSMQGRTAEDIHDVVQAVTTGIAAALMWGDGANRAHTILTKACETLCYLGLRLQANLQPTLFQIRTLLSDPEWREIVLPHVNRSLRAYWLTSFNAYTADAVPVVTNIIEQLASSHALRAFLGQPVSTYDARCAMDTGKVVVVCPAGIGRTDRIVSSLLIFDLFRAGLSRRDLPRDQRRPFHAFVDELTAVDGAAKGTIAAMVEQLRKFEVRGHFMTQMASRLTPTTRAALLQNQSILATSAAEIDAAKAVTRQWGNLVDPQTVVGLERYHHVMSVSLNGASTEPFLVRGPQLGVDLFADDQHPERVGDLDAAADRNLHRRPIEEILSEVDNLDQAIKEHLLQLDPPGGERADQTSPRPVRRRSARGSGGAIDLNREAESTRGTGSRSEVGESDVD